ncbi:hypothetical protein HGA88_00765 [Candidatus Roizmanbacteria bacterium]|nr:hypothetical protein [Candidatus Roizmanbacteria bacterium]
MNNISTVIVVKGSPIHIMETIKSVHAISAEILVADIGIDFLLHKELKRIQKVKILTIKEDVPYVELIREKVKNYAKYNHVLLLDPDEVVPQNLIDIIVEHQDCDYMVIPRKNIIFGKWIRYSRWYPDYQVRYFNKKNVEWPTRIHAQPQVNGEGITLEPKEEYSLLHYNYESLDEYLSKAMRYAKSEASNLAGSKTYNLKEASNRGIGEFVSRFFAEHGYKDGMHGFVLSFLQLFYSFLVYFYVWEMKKYPSKGSTEIMDDADWFFSRGMYETQHWLLKSAPPKNKGQFLKMKLIQKIFK